MPPKPIQRTSRDTIPLLLNRRCVVADTLRLDMGFIEGFQGHADSRYGKLESEVKSVGEDETRC